MVTATMPQTALSFLWLEVTGKCNLHCQHCYAGSSPQSTHGAMQYDDWDYVIREASLMGCRKIQFIGGEPTVYPHLAKLIDVAATFNMDIEVYTNLVSIKSSLWDVFQKHHVNIATSFYTAKPVIHEQITRGYHSFEKTVNNIKTAVDRGLPLRVGLVEVRPDQNIDETKRFLADLGVMRVGCDRARGIGRGASLIQVKRPEDELCGACARGKAAIVPSGDVYPCVFARHLRIGNVFDVSLREIITGQVMTATRSRLTTFFKQRAQNHPCDPWDCEPYECDPNCEPGECNPNACQPQHQCIPDWKEPCSPEQPCDPMNSPCTPDMACSPDDE